MFSHASIYCTVNICKFDLGHDILGEYSFCRGKGKILAKDLWKELKAAITWTLLQKKYSDYSKI